MVRPPRRQRGAAILIALLILTLVATLAAGMVWLQWRGIEVEAADRARTQADWLLKASMDWGNVILRTQVQSKGGATPEDDLGQPWATPLAETKLSSFLSADGNHSDDGGPEAYLSGQITDATSKYNLYNLLVPPGGANKFDEMNRLRILCTAIGVPPDTANTISASMTQSLSARTAITGGTQPSGDGVLMPVQVDDLVWFGIDPQVVRQLKPFVQLLPPPGATPAGNPAQPITNINANTASAEVLQAALPGISPAQAQQLILARRTRPFQTPADVTAVLGTWPPAGQTGLPPIQVSANSQYFEIYGQLRYEQQLIRTRSVVYRANGFQIQVLRRERIAPDAT